MELWTLSELAERVEAALTDYPGQANGRVRPVPDQRAIRWYTTTGLIDRPTEMRGRTALYGRRHLLQLVAIKRRQSQGHTLAQIQSELAGAPNQTLEPIAALPNPLPPNSPKVASTPPGAGGVDGAGGMDGAGGVDGPGGVDGAVSAAGGLAPDAGAAAESDASALASQPPLPRARFWADRSHDATPADAAPGDASHPTPAPLGAVDHDALTGDAGHREARRSANASLDGAEQVGPTATSGDAQRLAATSRRTAARDMRRADSAEAGAVSAPSGAVVAAVRLGGGVTLVLDQGGGVPDIARLVAAAVPLLAELGRQGLLNQPASGDEL